MENAVIWIVAVISAGTLFGVFFKMKPGFGAFNLRAIGIVLLAAFAALLALAKPDSLNAAVGILGVIAGYLFSFKDSKGKENGSSVDIESSAVGEGAKIAGRDINETIENMRANLAEVRDSVVNQYQTMKAVLSDSAFSRTQFGSDYLVNVIFERGDKIKGAMEKTIRACESEGWNLAGLSSDYSGADGIMNLYPTHRVGIVIASGPDGALLT